MSAIAYIEYTELTKTMDRCVGYINRYGDGLSADHLASLLPKTPRSLLDNALAHLVRSDRVLCGNDSWYYPVEEPKYLEEVYPITTSQTLTRALPVSEDQILTNDKLSIADRLLVWFQQRDPADQPISTKELSDLIKADRNSINKVLQKLLKQLSPEQAERLDAAIVRRKSTKGGEPETPAIPEDVSVSKSTLDEPEEEAPWVQEFRAHLLAKRVPEHAQHWQETLRNMDRVFAELGVPESQRARQHIQELIEWLSV